jgi:hypothetical protein
MSTEVNLQEIPRYGNAGVAFLGVEIGDTYLLIASVFLGLILGARGGMSFYVGLPVGGYFLTKLYLDWKSGQLPGSFTALMYTKGLTGYSSALKAKNVIYHGDSIAINKGFAEQEKEMLMSCIRDK